MKILLNRDQREGLAKVADNLATGCGAGVILGGLVEHKILLWQAITLVAFFFLLLYAGYSLRRQEESPGG